MNWKAEYVYFIMILLSSLSTQISPYCDNSIESIFACPPPPQSSNLTVRGRFLMISKYSYNKTCNTGDIEMYNHNIKALPYYIRR